jgi:GTP-binding protein LepA
MDQSHIRNFCIIAHIDHGKSTLADRLLQATGTISERDMQEQVLDDMELEREKGVTIKASAVRMHYQARDGKTYQLNLIDTPGHVDFTYEVSRALAACEGAVLVVDATQGVEEPKRWPTFTGLDHDLEIVPVVNRLTSPRPGPKKSPGDRRPGSGSTPPTVAGVGQGGQRVDACWETIVAQVPPRGQCWGPLSRPHFGSHYDAYKVIAYVRVVDGLLEERPPIRLMATERQVEPGVGLLSAMVPGAAETGRLAISPPASKQLAMCT